VKYDIEFLIGNSNLNATQESHAFYDNDQNTNEPKIISSPHAGLGGVHGTVLGSELSNIEFQTGNSSMNFNQETNDFIIDACITNTLCNMPHIPADHDSTFVTPQNKSEDNRGDEVILKNLDEADHAGQVFHEMLQQDEKPGMLVVPSKTSLASHRCHSRGVRGGRTRWMRTPVKGQNVSRQ
jgi:hypothetical protein